MSRYEPAVKPMPLVSIDTRTGIVRRYIRVLHAGVGIIMTPTDEVQVEGWTGLNKWADNTVEAFRQRGAT